MRPSTSSSTSQGASGLWNSISSPTDKADAEDNLVPNFGDRPVSQDSGHSDRSDRSADLGWTKQLPQRTVSQRGLWGSAQPLGDREAGTKRRWTVTEQKLWNHSGYWILWYLLHGVVVFAFFLIQMVYNYFDTLALRHLPGTNAAVPGASPSCLSPLFTLLSLSLSLFLSLLLSSIF